MTRKRTAREKRIEAAATAMDAFLLCKCPGVAGEVCHNCGKPRAAHAPEPPKPQPEADEKCPHSKSGPGNYPDCCMPEAVPEWAVKVAESALLIAGAPAKALELEGQAVARMIVAAYTEQTRGLRAERDSWERVAQVNEDCAVQRLADLAAARQKAEEMERALVNLTLYLGGDEKAANQAPIGMATSCVQAARRERDEMKHRHGEMLLHAQTQEHRAEAAEERARVLRGERDEARRFGEDAANRYNALLAETRILRCAFCDAAYPEGTPATQHEALTAHVLVCEKHPMRAAESEAAALREKVGRLEAALRVVQEQAEDHRCARGHSPQLSRIFQEAQAALAPAPDKSREG